MPVLPRKNGKRKRERGLDSYLNEKIRFGGEIKTRGAVYLELQREGVKLKYIDAYMMGAKTVKD